MARYSASTLWQLERAQTQLRMRQSQLRFWKPLLASVWLGSTGLFGWWTLGVSGRQQFWPWVLASCWAWLWPSHPVTWRGQTYAPQLLAQWLTDTVYHQPLSTWVLETVLLGLLPVGGCVVALLGYLRWRAQEPSTDEHVRGVQLFSVTQLQAQIDGPRPWWRRWRSPPASGLDIAGVALPPQLETSHLVIAGSTGTGKSTILRSVLRQIAARGETAIVLDPENELTPEFYAPHRSDVLLHPKDARSPSWSPWEELPEAGDAETLAASLVPDPPERGSGSTWYFIRSARELLVALLERLPSQDPHDLPRLLSGPAAELYALVADTPAAAHVTLDAPEQRSGVVATLQNAVSCFRMLPPVRAPTWSARRWVDERPGWLFLPCRERDRASVLALHAVWLDSLIRRLLDIDLTQTPPRRVWLVIDELATLRRLQHLEDLLTRGRKRGVAVVLGFQAMPQLRALYGRDTTATILAAPATKLFLRTGEPETARWCSQAIGSQEVIRPAESETAGPEQVRDAISVAYQRKEEAVVLASELQQLPEREGYLCIAGYDVARVAFPLLPAAFQQPPFVPRPEEPSTTTPPAAAPAPASPPPRRLVLTPKPLPAAPKQPRTKRQKKTPPSPAGTDGEPSLPLTPRHSKRRL